MKSQVIQLDSHDDVISIRDKMSWAKTPRVLLVFPRRSRILTRPLDLRLIKRHADGLGIQLALVSRSTEVRQAAEELKIPVFRNSSIAQRSAWPEREKGSPAFRRGPPPDLPRMRQEAFPAEGRWRNLPALRLGLFSLAVLTVLGLLLLFVPSATIDLKPTKRTQSLTLPIRASPDFKTVNSLGSVPAQTDLVVVEATRTLQATGSKVIPDRPAQGEIRFSNLTTSLVGIPSGTIVQTQGDPAVRFTTSEDGVVEAGVSKTVDVPIQALDTGSAGNLPAGQLVVMVGDLGASVSVSNPDPTTGGTDRVVAVATLDDRQRLYNALLQDLRQAAIAQFDRTHDPGDVLLPGTLSVAQVLSETYIPAEGQPGEQLTLDLQLQLQEQFVKGSDLQTLALSVLNSTLPAGQIPLPGSVSVHAQSTPVTGTDGSSHWQMQVQQTLQPRIDSLSVGQLVQGLRIPEASQKLSKAYPLATRPIIRMVPSWWPVLPWLPFRTLTELH
ncbi:MAG: baseplate J/gp47 family protein [Anaerolineales bacterium]|jgi:hypothetical protein